jgi:hypothetical protein
MYSGGKMNPKGDRPHMRYVFDRRTHLAYRRLMKTLNNSLKYESSDPAQFKFHVIEYSSRYGVKATLEAFKLKRSTFFYWKKRYKDSGKRLISLVPKSTRPKSVRGMETDWRLAEFIKKTRQEYGNVGARIIKPFLDEYAVELGILPIAVATIEKVIRRRKLTFEKRIKAKRKTKFRKLQTRKSPKVNKSGHVEVDTIRVCTISCVNGGTRERVDVLISQERMYDRLNQTCSFVGTNSESTFPSEKFR